MRDAIRDEQQQIKKQRELEGQIVGLIVATAAYETAGRCLRPRNRDANDETLDADTRLQGISTTLRRQTKAEEDSATRRVARRVVNGQYIRTVRTRLELSANSEALMTKPYPSFHPGD